MILDFSSFTGVYPSVDPFLLPANAAQVATAVRFQAGALSAFRAQSTVYTSGKAGTLDTIYRFGLTTQSDTQYWLTFTDPVSIVKGPIAGDTSERTYYTGDGVPKVTDSTLALTGGGTSLPNAYYNLGVPTPTSAPTIVLSGASGGSTDTRVYIYTWVTGWGEESAPSPDSLAVSIQTSQTATVTMPVTGPVGTYNVTHKRLYRTVTTNNVTDYFYVGEIPLATATYADTFASEVGETLPSGTWAPPPTDMHSLVLLPNGILVGASKNTVCPSEAYVPYAYPEGYQLTTDYDIVGLGVFGSSVFVGTIGFPYIITGVDPSSFTLEKLAFPYACSSRRSIASFGDGVVYASPDGLCYVGAQGNQLLTRGLFSRREWQALVPSSMHGYQFEGKYYGFYDAGGGTTGGFVFNPFGDVQDFTYLGFYADAGYVDVQRNALFLVNSSPTIKKWDANAASLTAYTWKSKLANVANPVNFGAAQVLAASYASLVVTFYFDNGKTYSKTVTSSAPFRLPSGYKTATATVQVVGTDLVRRVLIANSIHELKQV